VAVVQRFATGLLDRQQTNVLAKAYRPTYADCFDCE